MSSLFETLSLTCRRIILEDLQVDMEIGAHAEEHGRAQPVLVTIEVWVPFEYSTATGDNLDEVYSYSVLVANRDRNDFRRAHPTARNFR